jgi:hypothetical protein
MPTVSCPPGGPFNRHGGFGAAGAEGDSAFDVVSMVSGRNAERVVAFYHLAKRILGALGIAVLVAGVLRLSGVSDAPIESGGWSPLDLDEYPGE